MFIVVICRDMYLTLCILILELVIVTAWQKLANDLQVSLFLSFNFSSLFSYIVLKFNLSSLLELFLECHSHRPSVPVHFEFNYMDADWPSNGFHGLCLDLALISINGSLCLIPFLCLCFCIRTGNDSCSYKQSEIKHKQGPPSRHLSFFQNTGIYMCMFVMVANLTF